MATPAAEVEVTEGLVRALLREQHPDLADLALVEVASGWDNLIYRLGDALSVRLPRRATSAVLIEHEQRWLPQLGVGLPLPVPVPLRVGVPGCGYPWPWTISTWLPGRSAELDPPEDLELAAVMLGAFLRALHQPAPPMRRTTRTGACRWKSGRTASSPGSTSLPEAWTVSG